MTHPIDHLAAYAAGTLPPPEAEDIANHLRACASCRADAASWSALATGIRAATETATPSDPPPFEAIRARLSAQPAPSPRSGVSGQTVPADPVGVSGPGRPGLAVPGDLADVSGPAVPVRVPGLTVPVYAPSGVRRRSASARVAWGLLTRQPRLVGWRVWVVAVLVIGVGAGFAGVAPAGDAGALLSLVVPLVAAVAVAAACGADGEAAELVRSTPTSTRVLALARLTLVLAVTVGVGAAATAAVAWSRGDLGLAELFLTWFGPLVPLSAMSFALAVLWRPEAGVATVMAFWVLRLLTPTQILDHALGPVLDALWRPGLPLLLGALAVSIATVALAPLTGRRAPRGALS